MGRATTPIWVRILLASFLAALLAALAPVPAQAALTFPSVTYWGLMEIGRGQGAAAPLADGRVLLVGGGEFFAPQEHEARVQASAEIFNPVKGDVELLPAEMATGRIRAAAAPLPGGRVLIAGGQSSPETVSLLSSAEIFDPETGEFAETHPMAVKRYLLFAAPLTDGRVLVGGGMAVNGFEAQDSATTEIYDPGTDRFTPGPSMAFPRVGAAAVALENGSILIAGGWGTTSEIFEPAIGRFRPGPKMHFGGSMVGARLSSGRVVLMSQSQFQEYDPASESFLATGASWDGEMEGAAMAPLSNGRAVIAGPEPSEYGNLQRQMWVYESAPLATATGIDFGAVPEFTTSAPRQMVVRNRGAQNLQIKAASFVGTDARDFSLVEDCVGQNVGFEQACPLEIVVTPSSPGARQAALQLVTNSPSSPQLFPLVANLGVAALGIARSASPGPVAPALSPLSLIRPCQRRARSKKGRAGRHPVVRCARPAKKKQRGSKGR